MEVESGIDVMNIHLSNIFFCVCVAFDWILKLSCFTKICYFIYAMEFEGFLLVCFHLK